MTPKRRMPTDEQMLGWSIENPEDGPEEPVADRAMTPEEFAEHTAWLEEQYEADRRDASGIHSQMSQEQLRSAGVRIDLPTEAASPDPKDIAYADGTTLLGRLRKREEEEKRRPTRPPLTDDEIREAWAEADRAKAGGDFGS